MTSFREVLHPRDLSGKFTFKSGGKKLGKRGGGTSKHIAGITTMAVASGALLQLSRNSHSPAAKTAIRLGGAYLGYKALSRQSKLTGRIR